MSLTDIKNNTNSVLPSDFYLPPSPIPLNNKDHTPYKDLHVKGAKDDSEKPDLELVLGGFASALLEVGRVGTFGAKKYTENGWKDVANAKRRYSSAMLRHSFQSSEGEMYDEDSGLLHDAHAAWNALAKLYFTLKEIENKDV